MSDIIRAMLVCFFIALLLTPTVDALFHIHKQTEVPNSYLQDFSRRNHQSAAFQKLFDRGVNYFSNMDYRRAEQVYNTLLLINSKDVIALEKQAQVYLKQGQFELSASTLTRVLQIDPTYFPAHNSLALTYLWLKDFRRSIQHAKFLIEHQHAFLETYQSLTIALMYLGQLDNVLTICRVAIDAGAKHPQFEFLPALIALMQKDEAKAERIMADLLGRTSSADLLIYRILIHAYKNEQADLEQLLVKLADVPSDHPSEHLMQILLGLDMLHYVAPWGHLVDFMRLVQQKLSPLNPDFVLPYFVAAQAYRRVPNYPYILAVTSDGLKHFPSYIPFFELQGEAAFFLDQKDIARGALKTALDKRNNNPNYLAYYAILLVETGDFEKGLETLEMSSNLSANNPFAETALGYYYNRTGQPQRAEPHLKTAMDASIPYPLPWILFIQAKEQNRSYREAYTYALKARKILPRNETIQEMSARLAFTQEEYNNCVFMCAEAMVLFPDNQFFPVQRAMAQHKVGDIKAALTTLEKFGMNTGRSDTTLRFYLDLLMENGRYDDAYKLARDLAASYPRNRLYQEFLASYYVQNLNYATALKIYGELEKMQGRNLYQGEIGWVQFLSGNLKEAIEAASLATNSAPDNFTRALNFYRLGLMYSISPGRESDATQNYRQAVELLPRHEQARKEHMFYIQNTQNPKRRETAQKNLELFIQ